MRKLLLPLLLPLSLLAQKPSVPLSGDTIRPQWGPKDKKEPTAKEALLKITVYNLNRQKMAGVDVRALHTGSGQVWQGTTGNFGDVYFLLPKGEEYRIDAGDETGIETLRLSNERFARENLGITYLPSSFKEETRHDTIFQRVSPAQTPTRERLLVILNILDLDNKPLEGEEMYFSAKKAGKVYLGKTNKAGKTYLMLPMDDSYCVSTRFEAKLKCYDIPLGKMAGQLTITYNTIGTQAILKRQAERARMAAERDSIYRLERKRDSLDAIRRAKRALLADEDFFHGFLFGSDPAAVKKAIERRANAERDSIKRNPRYFEETGAVVKATLYRMRDRWKHKVIVTDLTGSMSPYMDQIVLWHALQLSQGEENQYLFFNDGDAKETGEKVIGHTGGIYSAQQSDMDGLLNTMKKTAQAGWGGDSPENDLEALLEGAAKKRGLDELILVADNYSDVRDLELLSQLKVPVHIILCGSERGVNEEYLEIAFKTGGSVHTIEQDIEDLAKLADGATITIGDFQYRVNRGKFIQVSRI